MSDWLYDSRIRSDGVTIPRIWVALALSVLIHILVLGRWMPQVRLPTLDEIAKEASQTALVVSIAPPSAPAPAPSPPRMAEATPAPARQARRPKAQPRPRPAPPAIALNRPTPEVPPPPREITPPPVAPAPARPTPPGDLSSYIAAQRRARNEPAPAATPAPVPSTLPAEDEDQRSKRADPN